jgi:hypothetical protein
MVRPRSGGPEWYCRSSKGFGRSRLFGLAWSGLQCDEGCNSSGRWQGTPGAWQWKALLVLAVLAFGGAVAALCSLLVRRYGWAALWAVATVPPAVGFLGLVAAT